MLIYTALTFIFFSFAQATEINNPPEELSAYQLAQKINKIDPTEQELTNYEKKIIKMAKETTLSPVFIFNGGHKALQNIEAQHGETLNLNQPSMATVLQNSLYRDNLVLPSMIVGGVASSIAYCLVTSDYANLRTILSNLTLDLCSMGPPRIPASVPLALYYSFCG